MGLSSSSLKTISVKTVVLGESSVGASGLIFRFVTNKNLNGDFSEPIISATFLTQSVTLEDRIVKFEIWQVAGQERYHQIAPMYYRGVPAAIVVYDITAPDTFRFAQGWVETLKACRDPPKVIALAGNRSHLSDRRAVSYNEASEYAVSNGLLFFETSDKLSTNVIEMFTAIAESLLQFPEINNDDEETSMSFSDDS